MRATEAGNTLVPFYCKALKFSVIKKVDKSAHFDEYGHHTSGIRRMKYCAESEHKDIYTSAHTKIFTSQR